MIEPGRLEDYGRALVDYLMAGNVEMERMCVSITLPADHPKIGELRRLLEELAYETAREREGAVEITQGLYKPGAEDRLKQQVRDMIGGEQFDQLMAQLDAAAQHMNLVAGGRAALKGLDDPKRIGGMVRLAGEHGLFRDVPQPDAIRLLNKAEAQERSGKEILDHARTEAS